MADRALLLAEADALEKNATDIMVRASRLRAIANAAPGAPSGPVADAIPPYDRKDPNWATVLQAAEKVGVAVSTIRAWIAEDTEGRMHRRIGKGRVFVYLPAILGGHR